ncbi:MAG: hypothetical protein R3C15_08440 [Thermoleophilia bacterium]
MTSISSNLDSSRPAMAAMSGACWMFTYAFSAGAVEREAGRLGAGRPDREDADAAVGLQVDALELVLLLLADVDQRDRERRRRGDGGNGCDGNDLPTHGRSDFVATPPGSWERVVLRREAPSKSSDRRLVRGVDDGKRR